jgi:3D (Asp-Asp-Asp) domain-containing protein
LNLLAASLFVVTAYFYGCDAPNPFTASGTCPRVGLTVAADTRIFPYGTWLEIEGVGLRRVEDIGGAIKGKRLDIFMKTCDDARFFGRQKLKVRKVVITPEILRREMTNWQ